MCEEGVWVCLEIVYATSQDFVAEGEYTCVMCVVIHLQPFVLCRSDLRCLFRDPDLKVIINRM